MLAAEAAFDALAAGRAARRARAPIPEAFETSWLHDELQQVAQLQAVVQEGPVRRHADDRHRAVAAAAARHRRRRGRCTAQHADHEYLQPAAECQPIAYPKPDGKLTFDRLSSVFISQHQPRGRPAAAPDAEGSRACRCSVNLANYAGPGEPLLPGRRLRVRRRRRRRRAAADQRAELRALQDLRHQGPDAEHRLGRRPKAAAGRTTSACDERRTDDGCCDPIASKC